MTSTSTQTYFVAGLLAALVLVPLVALAATTSPAAVQDGATFNASAGPEVTAGEDMAVATHNVFPDAETVRLGPVTVAHAGQIDVNLTGADTGLPTIKPQASPPSDLTLAHDSAPLSATVAGGSIDSLSLSDSATVGDSADDIELDTGGTGTTLTVSGLTTSQVTFIDTSGSQNQELATKSVSSGTASLSVSANQQREILLATSPPGFDVSIDSTNSSIVEGQTLTVTATVNNTGGAQGTQTVTLDAGGLGTNSTSVTLASGASQTVTLSLGTSTGDDGTYAASVASDDDSDSAQVTVLENVPNFRVNVTNSNAPIDPGGTLTFDIEVENVGAKGDTQGIVVESGGTTIETTPTTLASGASTTIPVSIDSSQTAIGATATVSSDNESEGFVARESAWSQVNKKDTGSRGPVAISPDGSLVAHGEGSNVIVYETRSETPVQNISVASSDIAALDWHPDGDRLAIGTFGNNLHVYDQSANTLLDTLNYGGTVEDVEWSPDGDKLLAGTRAGTAYVLDAASRGQLRTESLGKVLSVAWSGDAQRFAIGGDGDVQVFEVGGGRIFDANVDGSGSGGSTDAVRGVAFAADGGRLVVVQQGYQPASSAIANDKPKFTLSLYSVGTEAQLDRTDGADTNNQRGRMFADAVADPTDDRIAVASGMRATQVYTVGTGNLTQTESFGGEASSTDWAHSGQYIADSAGAGQKKEGDTWRVHTSRPVVDGTVTDSAGDPVANATVELSQGGTVLDSVPVESNGEYTLVPPDTGTYTVTASFTGSSSAVIDSKTVSVPSGGITVPFTVSVVQQGIAGEVVDSAGNPIDGATVEVVGGSATDTTTAGGDFLLSTGAGTVDVRASAAGFQAAQQSVSVTSGAITTGVSIQLGSQTGALTITGFDVPPGAQPDTTRAVDITIANTDANQSTGVVELLADEGGGNTPQNSTGVTLAGGATTTVTLDYHTPASSGQTVTLTATVGGDSATAPLTTLTQGVTGEVVDTSGNPIANATVEVVGGSATTTTTARGQFVLPTPTGAIQLNASAPSYQDGQQSVSVSSGTITSGVTIQLGQAATFSITGFDTPPGAPADATQSIDITVENIGQSQTGGTVTLLADEGGGFTAQNSTGVVLAAGATTTVTLDWHAPATPGATVTLKAVVPGDSVTAQTTVVGGPLNISVSNLSPPDGGQIGAQALLTERLTFDVDVPAGVGQVDLDVQRTSGGGGAVGVVPAVIDGGTTNVESISTLQGQGFNFGPNSWQVTATDPLGRTDSASFTFTAALTLGIRQETAPSQAVPGPVNVTIRELVDTDPTILDQQTVSGNVTTNAVQVDEGFIIDLEAPGYYDRAVTFAGAPAQGNLYMLNESNERTAVTAVLEGGTTDSADVAVQFERAHPASGVGKNYNVVAGDQFGPGAPVLTLQNGTRYRALLIDDGGREQNMGTFIPTGETWSVAIDPGVPPITQGATREPWGVGATITSDTGPGGTPQETVALRFDDRDGETQVFQYRLYERGNPNNVLASDFTVFPTNFSTQYQVAQSERGSEWVLEYTVYRGGEEIEGQRVLTPRLDATPDPLGSSTITIIGIGLILMVGGLFSVLSVGVGAIVTSLVGGLLWWLGWLGAATSGIAVVIALAVSTIYYIAKRGPR